MAWSNTPTANNNGGRYTYSAYTDFNDTNNQRSTVNSYSNYGTNQNTALPNLFEHTKDFKDVTSYNLMRGVPDFGSLVQFNPYETGYAAFIVCRIPKFIEMLAAKNTKYEQLVNNFVHIIEYEFKSFDGLQDINADTIQLGDDLNNINVINKVNMQSASEFTLTYDEKSGSPLTKFAKLYLTGIKDPRTQVKTYHGLIHSGDMEPGFENEVFTFLYIATDNTMREVEAAYLLIGCQLNSADTDMYNYTKGDINKRDVNVKFSGYPISCSQVDACAKEILTYLLSADAGARQIIVNSNDFNYTGINEIGETLQSYGATVSNNSAYTNNAKAMEQNRTKYSAHSYYTSESYVSPNNERGPAPTTVTTP